MASNPFKCTIVTPSEAVFDESVTYVNMPAWDGQQGVMTGQSPLLTSLGTGGLRADLADGSSRTFLIGSEVEWNEGEGEAQIVIDLGIGEVSIHLD